VFHCASGKDRTGVVAALTLTLLGVPEDVVVADFALTERARERLGRRLARRASGPHPTWPAFGHTPPEIMRNFLRDLDETYGSVARYCREHLAVDDELVAALQSKYLDRTE